jgi:two-component system OmpR family response regulator
MPAPKPPSAEFEDKDVLSLTGAGRAELREPDTELGREALKLLVLIDGKASVAQIARSATGMSAEKVRATLAALLADGVVAKGDSELPFGAIDPGDFFKAKVTSPDEVFAAELMSELAEGVSSLEDTGYYVSIARRAAGAPARKAGARLVAVVVEDDPDLAKLLKTYLKLEGIDTVAAANRAEVGEALGRPNAPDLVLLDVQLPDVDGFDVLSRIRAHALLKAVPVIMLTGEATRAAVLKGLHGGADGYVTKPFQIDVVIKAVQTVLGPAESGTPKR